MDKDFDRWNKYKKRIDAHSQKRLYREREIWWCSLGINVGSEQNGSSLDYQRPVLILRGISESTCFAVPLTTSKRKDKFRLPIGIIGERNALAVVSQLRLIDTKRLTNRIVYLDKETFIRIRKAAKDML